MKVGALLKPRKGNQNNVKITREIMRKKRLYGVFEYESTKQ